VRIDVSLGVGGGREFARISGRAPWGMGRLIEGNVQRRSLGFLESEQMEVVGWGKGVGLEKRSAK